MSNVKIGANVYNNVDTVKLKNADNENEYVEFQQSSMHVGYKYLVSYSAPKISTTKYYFGAYTSSGASSFTASVKSYTRSDDYNIVTSTQYSTDNGQTWIDVVNGTTIVIKTHMSKLLGNLIYDDWCFEVSVASDSCTSKVWMEKNGNILNGTYSIQIGQIIWPVVNGAGIGYGHIYSSATSSSPLSYQSVKFDNGLRTIYINGKQYDSTTFKLRCSVSGTNYSFTCVGNEYPGSKASGTWTSTKIIFPDSIHYAPRSTFNAGCNDMLTDDGYYYIDPSWFYIIGWSSWGGLYSFNDSGVKRFSSIKEIEPYLN